MGRGRGQRGRRDDVRPAVVTTSSTPPDTAVTSNMDPGNRALQAYLSGHKLTEHRDALLAGKGLVDTEHLCTCGSQNCIERHVTDAYADALDHVEQLLAAVAVAFRDGYEAVRRSSPDLAHVLDDALDYHEHNGHCSCVERLRTALRDL